MNQALVEQLFRLFTNWPESSFINILNWKFIPGESLKIRYESNDGMVEILVLNMSQGYASSASPDSFETVDI
jgi:hypothetical protein